MGGANDREPRKQKPLSEKESGRFSADGHWQKSGRRHVRTWLRRISTSAPIRIDYHADHFPEYKSCHY
jgi:hypothetical protein